jgi:hypothetical protein
VKWGCSSSGTTQRLVNGLVDHMLHILPKEEYKRSMPGRIIGVSQDANKSVLCVWHYKHVNNIKREKQHLTFVLLSYFL